MSQPADAFDLAASGMAAQRLQMDVIADNLSHANVTRADGSPFAARAARFEPVELADPSGDSRDAGSFADVLAAATAQGALAQNALLDEFAVDLDAEAPSGVRFAGYVEEPPGASGGQGVDAIPQMIALIAAGRAYDADVSALQAAKQMQLDALDVERL